MLKAQCLDKCRSSSEVGFTREDHLWEVGFLMEMSSPLEFSQPGICLTLSKLGAARPYIGSHAEGAS